MSNAAKVPKDVDDAMRRAGIPLEFRNQHATLEPYVQRSPQLPALRTRLGTTESVSGLISQGFFIVVREDTAHSSRVACGAAVCYLIGRAMVLRGGGVRCMTYARFAENLDRPAAMEAMQKDLDGARVLVLLGFDEPGVDACCPYGPRIAHRTEWAIDQMHMNGISFVLHRAVEDLTGTWWSRRLWSRINNHKNYLPINLDA